MSPPSFFFSNDWRDRKPLPLIDVLATQSVENPANTRDEDYSLRLNAKWHGANQPGDINSGFNFAQINRLIGIAMAALSISDNGGQDYRATCWKISASGRRLAVLGLNPVIGKHCQTVEDLANNADMTTFVCDQLKFVGSTRAKASEEGIILFEERNFIFRAYNATDDSVFPALTFDGVHTLNWTFTPGGISGEPTCWIVEKSASGQSWLTHTTLAAAARTAGIASTGTQYWRVRRSTDGTTMLDPESNVIKAAVT